jgi:hypothetical protein
MWEQHLGYGIEGLEGRGDRCAGLRILATVTVIVFLYFQLALQTSEHFLA